MKELLRKYRYNELDPDELETLRDVLHHSPDEELEAVMDSDWEEVSLTGQDEDSIVKEEILQSIRRIRNIRRRQRIRIRLQTAAACAVTLIIAGAALLIYNHSKPSIDDDLLCVSTGIEEMASVSLPDESKVKLNGNTSLSYYPLNFSSHRRHLIFSGEGYFNITHDPDAPFVIEAKNLVITVLGTEFDFSANPDAETSMLYLINGSVLMESSVTGEGVTVAPGERAEYNHSTGKFSVTAASDNHNITAWYSGEICFDNAPLDSVINFLESHYDCQLETVYVPHDLRDTPFSSLHFSGTLPTGNLPLALKALEKIYSIRLSPNAKFS